MLGLHQHRAQAGDGGESGVPGHSLGLKPCQRQFYKGEMQMARGGSLKNFMRQFGSALGRGCVELPDNDVELGGSGGEGLETVVGAEAAIEIKGGGAAPRKATGELAARDEREKLLRGPQGDRGGAGAGALQADLAQVQLL